MTIDKTPVSRRHLMKAAAFGILMATTLRWPNTRADELLDETDPMAVALKYRADVSTIKEGEIDGFDPSQNCANCLQFQSEEYEAQGACGLFQGKSVSARGWCSVWAKG